MSSSAASAQCHGVPVAGVAEPEPEVLLPLVDKKEKNHGAPLLVPVPLPEPQAPAVGLARRRRREMVRLNRLASSEGSKRARLESDTISASPAGSAKVAPEPQQQGADAAAAAKVVWPRSLSHGVHSVIGQRQAMEDTVDVAAPLPFVVAAGGQKTGGEGDDGWVPEFFAVYDGHGGAWVAEMCQNRLHVVLAEEMARLRLVDGGGEAGALWREAMLAAFARVDGEVAAIQIARKDTSPPHTEGSTAVVVVVEPRRIVVANCGDSRAVLCRGGVAVPLSTDHKPERPDELARIESVGGQVIYWQGPRVLGVLAMSRSIGDYFMKPSISSEPEVTVTDRTGTDEFIILGSDGLWDAMSNDYACRVVRYCLSGRLAAKYPATVPGSSATDAAKLLADLAAARGSDDNVSVVVVQLRRMVWRRKKQAAARQNGRT